MRWGPRGHLALILAAVVGVVAGTLVGIVTTGESPDANANDPDSSPTSAAPGSSGSPADPMRLGIPLVNLDCTGDTILVVGWGDTTSPLLSAKSSNSDEARYLDTAESCPTLYATQPLGTIGAKGKDVKVPKYVVYLGPFDNLTEPCNLRMSVDHKGDAVTSLKKGVKDHVQCLCVLPPETFPWLAVGMSADTRDGIYIRALQQLLYDIGRNPDRHITGIYDRQTANMVIPLQKLDALDANLYGNVEKVTWRSLRDRACIDYDF